MAPHIQPASARHSLRAALGNSVLCGLLLASATSSTGCASDGGAVSKAVGAGSGGMTSTGGTMSGGTTSTGGTTSGGTTSTGGDTTSGGTTSGGTTSTGGGTTDPTPPVHVVGACDQLGAVDVLEDITPPAKTGSNGITNILADPVQTGTIYAGTDGAGLWKSVNCGATWAKIDTGRSKDTIDTGSLWSMLIDPVNPLIIYAGALYSEDSSMFKSSNGGVDFDTLFRAGSEIAKSVDYKFFQDLAIDPTDHRHLVVTFHANCLPPQPKGCLGETKDGGDTWRLFQGPLDSWNEGAGPLMISSTAWLMGTTQNGLYYTGDSGATWSKVGPGANRMMYKAKNGVYYVGSDYGVYRSADDGKSWQAVPNSPKGFAFIGDGKRLFMSTRDAGDSGQPYFTSAEEDGATWTSLKTPKMKTGAVYFAYEKDHHVLYSANAQGGGLFRMVTQ